MAVTHLGFFQVFSKKMWKWVRKCEFANLRTSTCNVRAGVFLAKKIVEMCAKVQMCEISHIRTPARLQNVCNVHGVAARVFFCKKFFGYVCESADVRNFARPHTRTRAKCVQRAWCGCRSFVLQKKFWKCVWKCGCAKIRTSAHPHACEMCERVQVGVSGCKRVQAGARMCDLTFTHTMNA